VFQAKDVKPTYVMTTLRGGTGSYHVEMASTSERKCLES